MFSRSQNAAGASGAVVIISNSISGDTGPKTNELEKFRRRCHQNNKDNSLF